MMAEVEARLAKLTFGARRYGMADVAGRPLTSRGTLQLPDATAVVYAAMSASRRGRAILRPSRTGGGALEVDGEAAQLYLDDAGALLDLLLTLMQISWGLPARSAELTHLRIADAGPGEEPASSSIIFANGSLAIVQRVGKTDHMLSSTSAIARFLDPALAVLLLNYLTLVRCVERDLARHLHLQVEGEYGIWLAVNGGGRQKFAATASRFGLPYTTAHRLGPCPGSAFFQSASALGSIYLDKLESLGNFRSGMRVLASVWVALCITLRPRSHRAGARPLQCL